MTPQQKQAKESLNESLLDLSAYLQTRKLNPDILERYLEQVRLCGNGLVVTFSKEDKYHKPASEQQEELSKLF